MIHVSIKRNNLVVAFLESKEYYSTARTDMNRCLFERDVDILKARGDFYTRYKVIGTFPDIQAAVANCNSGLIIRRIRNPFPWEMHVLLEDKGPSFRQ